jgi:hypothetical protein
VRWPTGQSSIFSPSLPTLFPNSLAFSFLRTSMTSLLSFHARSVTLGAAAIYLRPPPLSRASPFFRSHPCSFLAPFSFVYLSRSVPKFLHLPGGKNRESSGDRYTPTCHSQHPVIWCVRGLASRMESRARTQRSLREAVERGRERKREAEGAKARRGREKGENRKSKDTLRQRRRKIEETRQMARRERRQGRKSRETGVGWKISGHGARCVHIWGNFEVQRRSRWRRVVHRYDGDGD